MVKLKNIIIIMLLLFFLIGCYPAIIFGDLCDDRLRLEKENYYGNELRIDGYYYGTSKGKYFSIYFFYNDGTLLDGEGVYTYQKLIEHEKKFTDDAWIKFTKNSKLDWGLFKIEGNTIAFERWYPSSGGPLTSYICSGEILNDTTFRITISRRLSKFEKRTEDEIYHFRQFSPKPDSTNRFIK